MDDDELRRGHQTCHIKFDEATAILTGDALQTLAFTILAEGTLSAAGESNRVRMMVNALAEASGAARYVYWPSTRFSRRKPHYFTARA